MGLFSNNKKLCPICGNPTPRIFSTKIEGTPTCKECDKKANQPLRQLFQSKPMPWLRRSVSSY